VHGLTSKAGVPAPDPVRPALHGAAVHGAVLHGAAVHGAVLHGAAAHGAAVHGAAVHAADRVEEADAEEDKLGGIDL
jgi:hypothetical protein